MKEKFWLILGALLLATLGFSAIQTAAQIRTVAKLVPVKEWLLKRNSTGSIISEQRDNLLGLTKSTSLHSFERGESIAIHLANELHPGKIIKMGDTLATLYINSQQERILKLQNDLQIYTARRRAQASGSKQTKVEQARAELTKAQLEYNKQRKISDRKQRLYNQNLISEAEYLAAADQLSVLDQKTRVCQAELASALSGVKDSELEITDQQIKALQNELNYLHEEVLPRNVLTAPFSGRLERSPSADTLLYLTNLDSALAVLPVPLKQASAFKTGQPVHFALENQNKPLTGAIKTISAEVRLIDGKPCQMVLAVFPVPSNLPVGDVFAEATLPRDRSSIKQYLQALIQ